MAQRGRKSASALAVVATLSDHRPPPPDGLTAEQQAEWTSITRRLPADYFPRETHGLLMAYIKHLSAFRVVCKLIDSFEEPWLAPDDGLARYDKLLAMREREGRALSSLATRLRITPQSRYHPNKAALAATSRPSNSGLMPWEKHA